MNNETHHYGLQQRRRVAQVHEALLAAVVWVRVDPVSVRHVNRASTHRGWAVQCRALSPLDVSQASGPLIGALSPRRLPLYGPRCRNLRLLLLCLLRQATHSVLS